MTTLPGVPPVADADRYVKYTIGGLSTLSVAVPFPVYGDGTDLNVYADGNLVNVANWSLSSASGFPMASLSQPITDGLVNFFPAISPTTIEVYGAIHPRQLVMPTAPGIGRREFNQSIGYILSALREAWTSVKQTRNLPFGFDAAGPLASKSSYDAQVAGFRYAVTDDGSGRPILYIKKSAVSGDWSGPINFQGPAGVNATGGTVSNVATGGGLKGGPITVTGTLALDPSTFGWGLRNRLLNGAMAIDQRNAGAAYTIGVISGVTNYSVDRWGAYLSAANTGYTAQRIAIKAGGVNYALRLARANGTTSTPTVFLHQVLETDDIIDLQGKTVTLSWKARAGANFSPAAGALTWTLIGGTGTDQSAALLAAGSWTGQTNLGTGSVNLLAGITKFSAQISVGSSITQLAVRFSFVPTGTAGAADYMDITDVQLEQGAIAAADVETERTRTSVELARCQRYYQKSYGQSAVPGTNVGAGNGGIGFGFTGLTITVVIQEIKLTTPMRVAPAVVSYDNTGNVGKVASHAGGVYTQNVAATIAALSDASIYLTFSASTDGFSADYTANAEL